MLVAVAMLVGTVYLFEIMPRGFIPSQDSGFTFGVVMGPQDMSFDSMAQHLRMVSATMQADPNVAGVGAFGGVGAGERATRASCSPTSSRGTSGR
jgi:multidrug efflux pump subunit AcrB